VSEIVLLAVDGGGWKTPYGLRYATFAKGAKRMTWWNAWNEITAEIKGALPEDVEFQEASQTTLTLTGPRTIKTDVTLFFQPNMGRITRTVRVLSPEVIDEKKEEFQIVETPQGVTLMDDNRAGLSIKELAFGPFK